MSGSINVKKIVITGMTSMLGVATAEEWLKNGVGKIYAVVRESSPNLYRLPKDERIVKINCEACNYDNLPDLISETCDVFYHMSWEGTGVKRDTSVSGQCHNISYTLEALKSAKRLGCTKFIVNVLGVQNLLLPVHRRNMDCPILISSLPIRM